MRTVYIADDGTEFSSYSDCESYEEFLKHPNLKGIIFLDEDWNPMRIESYKDILDDHIYQKTEIVMLHNDEEVSDFQWLVSWEGWCEWEQIASPGDWMRAIEEDTQEAKWSLRRYKLTWKCAYREGMGAEVQND